MQARIKQEMSIIEPDHCEWMDTNESIQFVETDQGSFLVENGDGTQGSQPYIIALPGCPSVLKNAIKAFLLEDEEDDEDETNPSAESIANNLVKYLRKIS